MTEMNAKRQSSYAAIDIGTNTILMLIGRRDSQGAQHIVQDMHSIARLGQNVDKSRTIQPEAVERAAAILQEYRQLIEKYNVTSVKAVATSALRDASNGASIALQLSQVLGWPVEIISGSQEAALCFLGSTENDAPVTILDIGGGSTEFISGSHHQIDWRTSIDIGAVRLTERYFHAFPVDEETLHQATLYIRQQLNQHIPHSLFPITAVAGTPTSLASVAQGLKEYTPQDIHGYKLSSIIIEFMMRQFFSSTMEEILLIDGINPKRADILPAGTLILSEVLKHCSQNYCTVSIKGLRYGILKSMIDPAMPIIHPSLQ
jgi:exopolyphosphatase/guanosine-5'-triphosphate,3'-diphosphate pyrophosphatase